MADIARAEGLEVNMNAQMAFVLSAAVAGAGNDVEGGEAHSGQLPVEDPRDINSLLAGAVHDVP